MPTSGFSIRRFLGMTDRREPKPAERPVTSMEAEALLPVLEELLSARRSGQERVHATLNQLKNELQPAIAKLPDVLPSRLAGRLLNPDGTPAVGVAISLDRPDAGQGPRAATVTVTRADGGFILPLSAGPIPDEGIHLRLQGGGLVSRMPMTASNLRTSDGKVGTLYAPQRFASTGNGGLIGGLAGAIPAQTGEIPEVPEDTVQAPGLMMDPEPASPARGPASPRRSRS